MDDRLTAAPRDGGILTLPRLLTLLIAGALGTLVFGIFGEVVSPLLGGSRLAPVPLAGSVFKTIAGFGSKPAAHGLHYLAGMVCYPLAFALIARPIWMRFAPALPWYAVAVCFGVLQWVGALYVLAHLVAGMPPFLNFSGITWAALWGHILYALTAVGVSQHLDLRFAARRGQDAAVPAE